MNKPEDITTVLWGLRTKYFILTSLLLVQPHSHSETFHQLTIASSQFQLDDKI